MQEKAIQGTRNWNALFQVHPTIEQQHLYTTQRPRRTGTIAESLGLPIIRVIGKTD